MEAQQTPSVQNPDAHSALVAQPSARGLPGSGGAASGGESVVISVDTSGAAPPAPPAPAPAAPASPAPSGWSEFFIGQPARAMTARTAKQRVVSMLSPLCEV